MKLLRWTTARLTTSLAHRAATECPCCRTVSRMFVSVFSQQHGWDGSGDDGGSCIDGRLTSAWNWCSLLPKKPFAPIFYLAGQYGFDGGWGSGLGD